MLLIRLLNSTEFIDPTEFEHARSFHPVGMIFFSSGSFGIGLVFGTHFSSFVSRRGHNSQTFQIILQIDWMLDYFLHITALIIFIQRCLCFWLLRRCWLLTPLLVDCVNFLVRNMKASVSLAHIAFLQNPSYIAIAPHQTDLEKIDNFFSRNSPMFLNRSFCSWIVTLMISSLRLL